VITRVIVLSADRNRELSVEGFLQLPLDERIQLILERAVTFYDDRTLIDHQEAMKYLRTLKR
jgi:hypothetical protein